MVVVGAKPGQVGRAAFALLTFTVEQRIDLGEYEGKRPGCGRSLATLGPPGSGIAHEDYLRQLAGSVAAQISTEPGRALLATIFSDAIRIPAIDEIKKAFFAERMRQAEGFINRAMARGELPKGTQAGPMIEALMSPLYYRLLVTDQPVDRELADRLATQCLVAARAGAFSTPRDPQRH